MSTNDKQPQQGAERAPDGRFLPGCAPGPGRPSAQREAAYLRACRAAVSPVELAAACRSVLGIVLDDKAKPGDRIRGLECLCRHFLPQPADRLDVELSLHDPAEASEFRIAGATVGEIDKYAAERIRMLLIEQVQYEKALEQQGLLPRRSNNSEQQ